MENKILYTCMGCGFKTLDRVLSEDEICPICNHHETSGGMERPFESPFVNDKSLVEYQQNILKNISYSIKEYKKGKNVYMRNELWKPIKLDELDRQYSYFPRFKYEEFFNKWPEYDGYYVSLFKEAQKYNPDDKVHLDL